MGVRPVTAVAAAALALAACAPIDYRDDTYTYTIPKTQHADAKTVLVRDGVVTDIWVSSAARDSDSFGYAPYNPATFGEYAEGVRRTTKGGTLTVCAEPGTADEWCQEFQDIRRASSVQAAWEGLADGSYTVASRSVTWSDEQTLSTVTIDGGSFIGTSDGSWIAAARGDGWPSADGLWIRYWVDGEDAPFAVCYDDPRGYDEEGCWAWTLTAS